RRSAESSVQHGVAETGDGHGFENRLLELHQGVRVHEPRCRGHAILLHRDGVFIDGGTDFRRNLIGRDGRLHPDDEHQDCDDLVHLVYYPPESEGYQPDQKGFGFLPDRRSISDANFEPFLSIFTRRWRTPVSPVLSVWISSVLAPRISSVWSSVSSLTFACASRRTPFEPGLRFGGAFASGAGAAGAGGGVAGLSGAGLLKRGDISPSTSCSMCAGMSSSSRRKTPLALEDASEAGVGAALSLMFAARWMPLRSAFRSVARSFSIVVTGTTETVLKSERT